MSAAKFWPQESRNLIGPLTIELSTEVNCCETSLTYFDATAIAKEQVCRRKCVALRYSCRFRRIVIISFSPENDVRFDASRLSLGAEKYSNSEVSTVYVSRFIASCSKFSFEGFQQVLKR